MALPKFLKQIRDGQRVTVYRWTPSLAKRKDMTPITGKEAKKILDTQEEERQAIITARANNSFEDTDDDFQDNEITADPDLELHEKKAAEHPSFKTQDTIKVDELTRIPAFKSKNDLEVYFLEKYRFEMIPGTRESMESQAIAFVEELAKHGKLYAKLNE